MTFALVIAVLVVALVVSLIVMVQAYLAHAENTRLQRQREVTEVATEVGGFVDARLVAARLGLDLAEADHLLRSMVDGAHLVMAVDPSTGAMRFEFPRLTRDPELGMPGAYSRVRARGE